MKAWKVLQGLEKLRAQMIETEDGLTVFMITYGKGSYVFQAWSGISFGKGKSKEQRPLFGGCYVMDA